MRKITLSDITMRNRKNDDGRQLAFREKIDLCRLLDRLGVDSIETGEITNLKTDGLFIKSISSAVSGAEITVPVPADDTETIEYIWSCLSEAKRARLQICLPVSTVQMEYMYHKKPDAMLEMIKQGISFCKSLCDNVEFCAEDSGRSEEEFLFKVIETAREAGADIITLCDTAGGMLPEDIYSATESIREIIPENIRLGVRISNNIHMAQSCALYAVKAGADEVKVSSFGDETVSLEKFSVLLREKKDWLGVSCGIKTTEIHRVCNNISKLFDSEKNGFTPFTSKEEGAEDFYLTQHDSLEAVKKASLKLGYDLSEDDAKKVYDAFAEVSEKKEKVSARELEALIATHAMQVPAAFTLKSYIINSGNVITSTSSIELMKDGESKKGVCAGDGPIDASFSAIEQITGTAYELDDFQIRAVTEGIGAMGEALVRLRFDGKLYSGRGLSTDIVGASIMAYINALNKIIYEEESE